MSHYHSNQVRGIAQRHYSLIEHNLTAGHAESVHLIVLYQFETPGNTVQQRLLPPAGQIFGKSSRQTLTHLLNHSRLHLVVRYLGGSHHLVVRFV